MSIFFRQTHLQDEMKQYEEILKKMKDYDMNISKERVAKEFREKELKRLEVSCIKFVIRKIAVNAVHSSGVWLIYLYQLDQTYLTNNCINIFIHYHSLVKRNVS